MSLIALTLSLPLSLPLGFAHLCRGFPARAIRSIDKGGCKKRSNLDKMLRARVREETDLRSTMNELINVIVQKTGISEENAQKAVQVTLGFLKTKMPAPLAGQLDSFLTARTPTGVNPVAVGAQA
jgi:hypothetical protein